MPSSGIVRMSILKESIRIPTLTRVFYNEYLSLNDTYADSSKKKVLVQCVLLCKALNYLPPQMDAQQHSQYDGVQHMERTAFNYR